MLLHATHSRHISNRAGEGWVIEKCSNGSLVYSVVGRDDWEKGHGMATDGLDWTKAILGIYG